ncbi:MAG: MFS transporter [Aliidongia sp.]
MPAGALVDAIPRKSIVALASIAAFAASALMFALWPIALSVYLAEILHGFSSCTLGPAIAALSLAIAGTASLGTRLGRNARFASIGNGVGAALMGACGYYLPERYVFVLTAVLTAPAIVAVLPISRFESALAARPIAAKADHEVAPERWRAIGRLIADPRLAVFAVCAALFTLANAALLPLVSSAVTKRATDEANLLIAACIILPQILVALLSPTVAGSPIAAAGVSS